MKQLGKTGGQAAMVQDQDPSSAGAAEEGDGAISLDEDEEAEIPEAERDGMRAEPLTTGGIATSTSLRGFHTAWTSQMAKEGLVGALVALAYPDRVAV